VSGSTTPGRSPRKLRHRSRTTARSSATLLRTKRVRLSRRLPGMSSRRRSRDGAANSGGTCPMAIVESDRTWVPEAPAWSRESACHRSAVRGRARLERANRTPPSDGRAPTQIDVPEGAFDVKSLRRSRRPLSPAVMQPGVCLRARASKPRLSRVGKGSQGRALPARRGSLYCPVFSCCQPRWGWTTDRWSWSPLRGRTQRTSPLLQRTARAFRFGCTDIPSFR
jgi:hypothetical protein